MHFPDVKTITCLFLVWFKKNCCYWILWTLQSSFFFCVCTFFNHLLLPLYVTLWNNTWSLLKTVRISQETLPIWPVLYKAHTNKFYIYWQCACIVFILAQPSEVPSDLKNNCSKNFKCQQVKITHLVYKKERKKK